MGYYNENFKEKSNKWSLYSLQLQNGIKYEKILLSGLLFATGVFGNDLITQKTVNAINNQS